jgi:hypothetical protein
MRPTRAGARFFPNAVRGCLQRGSQLAIRTGCDWTGFAEAAVPEARQASAISDVMSSSGRRLKSVESSPMILPIKSR